MSTSVKRSHSTLVFFKAACHVNDGAEKDFLGPTLHEKCPSMGFCLARILTYLKTLLW